MSFDTLHLAAHMPAEIILQQSPDALALLEKREQLAAVRDRLSEREADLAQLRAQLKAFEARYLREVGGLYAELDDVEARILEHEARLANSDAARQQAQEARQRAQESHTAAFGDDATDTEETAASEPSPDLKALFRELAKRIHPDFARDPAEGRYLHMLMSRANQAYSRGDAQTLQRLLDDYRELNDATAGESTTAESLRVTRQIRHAERDLARLEAEHHATLASEIAQLFTDAELAATEHRDLLVELATRLQAEIADARSRFERLAPSISKHSEPHQTSAA